MRAPEAVPGNVLPLHPIRVLLAMRDTTFVRTTSFLLRRDGFLVETTRRTTDLVELIDRHRPDVVVLDASDSLASTAHTMSAVQERFPRIALVIVAEGLESSVMRRFRLLPKWSSVERIAGEIERAYTRFSDVHQH